MSRWHYRRSLASRVALLTVLAVGVSITLMAMGSMLLMRHQLQSTVDDSLLNRATKAAQFSALAEVTNAQYPAFMLGAADIKIMFVDSSGRVRSADPAELLPSLGAPEQMVAEGIIAQSVRTTHDVYGTRYRVATVSAGRGVALALAQPVTSLQRDLNRLNLVLGLVGALGILISAPAGWLVARNGLRPVRRLTSSVERIARTEDLTPLVVEGGDEVARLGGAFNQMLQALSASRDRQRRMIADASHELRTPLTSLRTNMELLKQADRRGGLPPQARDELLGDVSAQIEELSTLVGDLVELNRDEPMTRTVQTLDLVGVTEAALTRVRRRAPSVTFDLELQPWIVTGDESSLERAITNLLDNAAKWSPADGRITVTLVEGVLTIDDEGPGIAAEDLPHVFDRFYRSEESRAMPGSGLGLSIVRQVAERHSGAVRADRSPSGGARLQLWIPSTVARNGDSPPD